MVRYEHGDAIITAAAKGYQIASRRGVTDITPEDALEVTLEMQKTGPMGMWSMLERLQATEGGRLLIKIMGAAVTQKVALLSEVDRQV